MVAAPYPVASDSEAAAVPCQVASELALVAAAPYLVAASGSFELVLVQEERPFAEAVGRSYRILPVAFGAEEFDQWWAVADSSAEHPSKVVPQ